MPSVYDPDNFAGRVNLAALYISQRRESSRSFDTCFEMYDGNAVGVALYRRAIAKPDSALALNLSRYLNAADIQSLAEKNAHRTNLAAWARELRAEGEAASRRMFAQMERQRTERQAQQAAITEPGAEGLPQLVISGCDHMSHGARAQRLAEQPIKPKAAQLHTMPERGLWGDHGQGELFT